MGEQLDLVAGDYDLAETQNSRITREFNSPRPNLKVGFAFQYRQGVDGETALVDILVKALDRDNDLSTTVLPEKLTAIAEVTRLQGQIARLRERLQLTEDPHTIEDRDWTDVGQWAQGLLRLLNACNNRLPPGAIQQLTMPEECRTAIA